MALLIFIKNKNMGQNGRANFYQNKNVKIPPSPLYFKEFLRTKNWQRHTYLCPKNHIKLHLIKRPWKGAYLFSSQFPRHRRHIMVSLEYLPYY